MTIEKYLLKESRSFLVSGNVDVVYEGITIATFYGHEAERNALLYVQHDLLRKQVNLIPRMYRG